MVVWLATELGSEAGSAKRFPHHPCTAEMFLFGCIRLYISVSLALFIGPSEV